MVSVRPQHVLIKWKKPISKIRIKLRLVKQHEEVQIVDDSRNLFRGKDRYHTGLHRHSRIIVNTPNDAATWCRLLQTVARNLELLGQPTPLRRLQ